MKEDPRNARAVGLPRPSPRSHRAVFILHPSSFILPTHPSSFISSSFARRGVTLIELLVVAVIILMMLALPPGR